MDMATIAAWACMSIIMALGVDAATFATDTEALMEIKAAIDSGSIHSTTCLGSWDFSVDPCESRSTSKFVCGFRCDNLNENRRITSLTLDGSGYKGTLSPFLGNLTYLQVLDVSGNSFTGSIPASLGQLRSLVKLDMSRNLLSGSLPESLGSLSNLTYLSLSSNQLTGPLPSSFNNLYSLERLFVDNNLLSGFVPSLNGLHQLNYLDASNNQLTGELPSMLPPLLMQVSLRKNALEGRLPPHIIQLQQLEVLDLSYNHFSGELDASLFNSPALQQINLSHNNFTSFGSADNGSVESALVAIDMSFNQIKGPLPIFLASMRRLSALSLRYNKLSGTIPNEFASKASASSLAGEVRPLVRFFLDGNYLIGDLPYKFLTLPNRMTASFIFNCLTSCPLNFTFCQGGGQRPREDCLMF